MRLEGCRSVVGGWRSVVGRVEVCGRAGGVWWGWRGVGVWWEGGGVWWEG